MSSEVQIPERAWTLLTDFPSPEELEQAARLIVAEELERIANSISSNSDPAADAWMKAEAVGRRDVRRLLLARASELRGEGKDGETDG